MKFISPWIHTTEKCNLKCHYCYLKGSDKNMPPEVYKALGKLVLETPSEKKHLRFAGGEPTIVFDMWESFARSMLKHKEVSVEVLTNLHSPPSNFWKFSELDGVGISVSIDNGKTEKVFNKNIIEKVRRLKHPWIMTTITQENVNRLEPLAEFIGMNNYGWAMTTDYFEKTIPHWEILSESLLKVVSILKDFRYDFTKISFNNFSIKSGFSGCRAGNEMFAVACNGDIYRCQTYIENSKKIGSVFSGYTRTKICTRELCQECSIKELCTGWCRGHFKIPNLLCNTIKIFANEVLKEIENAK